MAHCCNCGIVIPDDDKTRLCDKCKHILLPFIRLVGASTSSAVKRLRSNEKNLRNAGVTDSGMSYLMKLCELQDKKREEKVKASAPVQEEPVIINESIQTPVHTPAPEPLVIKIDDKSDIPVSYIKKQYGTFIVSAEIVLWIVAILFAAWFALKLLTGERVLDIIPLFCAFASVAGAYIAGIVRKMLYDLGEIKKKYK